MEARTNGAAHAPALRGVKLQYVTDDRPGISRVKRGTRFSYRRPDGSPLRDPDTLERIRRMAIPPAWRCVWICPTVNGHLQATGRDARGRKQHRYHPRWTAVRDDAKYSRMLEFGEALPSLQRRLSRDLALRGLPKRKVLAAVVQLLQQTLIRIGNDEYARDNGSFGLTTFTDRHAHVNGRAVRFRFRGKSGKLHDVTLADPRLARVVRNCQELPGSQLFQYHDATGTVCDVNSTDVNLYLRSAMGAAFTAKDFRTWAGTMLAARALAALEPPRSKTHGDKQVLLALDAVARVLGNTRSVCRKCYVHPAVIDAYLDGRLDRALRSRGARQGLGRFEAAVVRLVRRRARPRPAAARA